VKLTVSDLSTIIQNLQELERTQQLNFELLEELGILLEYMNANNFPIPDREKFNSLLAKTHALMNELYFSSPKTLQYRKVSRRKVTDFKTDEDVPVPIVSIYKGV
jgi:hypothetical protein